MKRLVFFALSALCLAPARAELPSYSGWPSCVPILGFSETEIGVASFQTFPGPRPTQRWVCMTVDRSTVLVTPVDETDFDARFPGVRQAANRAPGDCSEMIRPSTPLADNAAPPACIDTKVLCDGREIPVKVSAAVTAVRCPGHLFSAATLIDGKLWVGINPLDPFYRALDGSDVLVQSPQNGAVLARRSSEQVGGRSVCAIRKDPATGHVWATTETGLVEFMPDGAVIRTLRFRAMNRPMESRGKP